MQCDEAQALISASIDGEVSDVGAGALRQHMAACAACAGVQADFRRLSQQLKSAGREILPTRLETRVRKPWHRQRPNSAQSWSAASRGSGGLPPWRRSV